MDGVDPAGSGSRSTDGTQHFVQLRLQFSYLGSLGTLNVCQSGSLRLFWTDLQLPRSLSGFRRFNSW